MWLLTFQWDSSTFFNNSIPAKVEYGELELLKTKPENYGFWILKLEYRGYPGLQLPEIIWTQKSNPLANTAIQNFNLYRNSIERYLSLQFHLADKVSY